MGLTTDRLLIRDWRPLYDAQHAADVYGDPRVVKWLLGSPDQSIQATQERLQGYCDRSAQGLGIWAVVEKAIDRAIGSILLVPLPNSDGTASDKVEIGWHFRPASWGYGYATEAARAILHYGFTDLQLPAIYAVTRPDNVRSQRVMARLGMTPLGITADHYGQPLERYRLTADSYSSGQLSSMVDKTASISAPLT